MKSIILCENALLKRQDDTKDLKENVKVGQAKESIKLNGIADDKKLKPKVPACNSEKIENFQNGNEGKAEEPSVTQLNENGQDKTAEKSGNSEGSKRGKCGSSSEKNMTVTKKSGSRLEGTKNSFDVSENSNARNSSKQKSEWEKERTRKNSVNSLDEVSNETSEELIIDDNERIGVEVAINNSSNCVDNEFLSDVLPEVKGGEAIERPLSVEIFDVDSNKENVKDDKSNAVEDLAKGDDEEEAGNCEIQVEKVQSVLNQDSDFAWLPCDSEKTQEDSEVTLQEKEVEEPEDKEICSLELEKNCEEEKETDCQVVIDSVSSVHVESELLMEVEEADQGMEVNEEENKSDKTEWDEPSDETEFKKEEDNESRVGSMLSKKRPLVKEKDEDPEAKKFKPSEDEELEGSIEEIKVGSFDDVKSIKGDSSKVGVTFIEEETSAEVAREENMENEDSERKDDSAAPSSSFLASFRGTLKNMTRSDLEELIVQKLCEVITERSNVGELRRKAQALEQDQERWKQKVHTLTKQMKEMETVMKKYMSEVQKQLNDGTSPMTTPLRVTRSVGLQVSFYTYGSKPNVSQSAAPCPAQSINNRNSKGSPKPCSQYGTVSQNLRSKSMPASSKNSSSVQKGTVTQQRRNSTAPNSATPNRTATTATVPIANRPVQNQVPGLRPVYKAFTSTAQQLQQQSQQQKQQNGSKVIDLTDDDDQRINNTGKPNTPMRVVSQLPQSGTAASGRFAYLVPATSTSAGLGNTQSRQVLIATPTIQTTQQNRQIMCSMPPLLFKGGNQVQSTPQAQAVNQNNGRVILPKVLRHPAPLPQAPIRNWANMKQIPPRPALKISKVHTGIVLSWNMILGPEHAPIRSYQLYAYQESNTPPATSLWKKVGDVKALPLPMACTLTQFMSGHKYHFAVRAVDLHSRIGPFSFPGTIVLVK